MAQGSGHVKLEPIYDRKNDISAEIAKLRQIQRGLIAWAWQRHEEVSAAVTPGSEADRELRSKGFPWSPTLYLKGEYSATKSDGVSRAIKSLKNRGMILPFSQTGKKITHLRLTELGMKAGSWFHFFGLKSPAELDEAAKYASYPLRREVHSVKRDMLSPDGMLFLRRWYKREPATVVIELEERIRTIERRFVERLTKQPRARRAELIDLGRYYLSCTKKYEFFDGAPADEFLDLEPSCHRWPLDLN